MPLIGARLPPLSAFAGGGAVVALNERSYKHPILFDFLQCSQAVRIFFDRAEILYLLWTSLLS